VNPRVDRFLVGSGDGLGALWFATAAFILGFVGILGLTKGAWWAAFLLVPAFVLAILASRTFNRRER
jgi:membrane protein implicated in regulation of membrane protease activity